MRRQDEYLESLTNQRIKTRKFTISTYPECLNSEELSNFPKQRLDYYEELEKIKLAIGVENIVVRPYEKLQFKDKNIFSDFLSIFDIQLTQEYNIPSKIVNPRLNRDFMEIKRICNTLPINDKVIFNVFCESLIKISNDTHTKLNEEEYSMFSYEERLEIINKYFESNKKVAIEYLGKLNGELFIQPIVQKNAISNEYEGPSSENIIKTFGYLICKQFEEINKLKEKNNDIQIEQILSKINVLEEENKKLLSNYSFLEEKSNKVLLNYNNIINSKSWRLTKPIRLVKKFFTNIK